MTEVLPLALPFDFRILSIYNYQMLQPVTNNNVEATALARATEPACNHHFGMNF